MPVLPLHIISLSEVALENILVCDVRHALSSVKSEERTPQKMSEGITVFLMNYCRLKFCLVGNF